MSDASRCGPPPSARAVLALVGVLAVAAGMRAIAWSNTAVLFNDGPIFLAMAAALREGHVERVLDHPQHPLYPALVAAVEGLGLAPETAAVCVSLGGGLLAIAAIFRLAWSRFGPACAWGSAWLVALHPWAVDFSADVMSDGLYMGLHLAALALLIELLERPRAGRAAGFAFVAGLAYWTRPEGLSLFVIAVLAGGLRRLGSGREGHGLRRVLAASLGVGLLFVVALRAAEWRAGDGVALSQKKSVGTLLEGGPSPEALARDRAERRARRDDPAALPLPESSIRVDSEPERERPEPTPAGLVRVVGRVVATAVSALRHEVALLALIGAVLLRRGRVEHPRARTDTRAYEQVVAVSLGLHALLLVLLVWGAGYVSRRHALVPGLALVPLAVGAAISGLDRVWVRFGRRAGLSGAGRDAEGSPTGRTAGFAGPRGLMGRDRRIVCSVLVVLLALAWGPRDLRARRVDRLAERRAAEWLAASGQPERPVAAQKRRTAYYAGATFVPLPDGRDGTLERQLRGRRAGYVIIDRAKLSDHRGLAEGIGHWLVPIHVERRGRQEVLVLALAPAPAH